MGLSRAGDDALLELGRALPAADGIGGVPLSEADEPPPIVDVGDETHWRGCYRL
jgi:hypothetical protein